jgi:hypothetical protein
MGKISLLLRDDVAPKFLVLVLSMLSQRSQGSFMPEKVFTLPSTIFFLFNLMQAPYRPRKGGTCSIQGLFDCLTRVVNVRVWRIGA